MSKDSDELDAELPKFSLSISDDKESSADSIKGKGTDTSISLTYRTSSYYNVLVCRNSLALSFGPCMAFVFL